MSRHVWIVSVLVLSVAVLTPCGAVDLDSRADSRWDIRPWRLLSGAVKDLGHEQIILDALKALPETDQRLLIEDELTEGVRYPDMPGTDGDTTNMFSFLVKFLKAEKEDYLPVALSMKNFAEENRKELCEVDSEQCETLVSDATNIATREKPVKPDDVKGLLTRMMDKICDRCPKPLCKELCEKLNAKVLEANQKAGKVSAIAASHVGCKQPWHAMCPVGQDSTKREFIFSNKDVQNFMLNQLLEWWKDARSRWFDYLKCTKGEKSEREMNCAQVKQKSKVFSVFRSWNEDYQDTSDFPIANGCHSLADSYAPGHAIRDRSGEDGCGGIFLFQGYTMQHNNPMHGVADHTPGSTNIGAGFTHRRENDERRAELQACSVKANTFLLGAWAQCKRLMKEDHERNIMSKECAFPKEELKFRIRLGDGHSDQKFEVERQSCGGSAEYYSAFSDRAKGGAEEKKKLQDRDLLQERVIKVSFGKGKQPFADCKNADVEAGTCEYLIQELKFKQWKLDGTPEENEQANGIQYETWRRKMINMKRYDMIDLSCLGQMSKIEETEVAKQTNAKNKWGKLATNLNYESAVADATTKEERDQVNVQLALGGMNDMVKKSQKEEDRVLKPSLGQVSAKDLVKKLAKKEEARER